MEIHEIIIEDIIIMTIIMVRTDRIIIPNIVKGIMNLQHKRTMLQLNQHLLLKFSRTGMTTGREVTKNSILVLEGQVIGEIEGSTISIKIIILGPIIIKEQGNIKENSLYQTIKIIILGSTIIREQGKIKENSMYQTCRYQLCKW